MALTNRKQWLAVFLTSLLVAFMGCSSPTGGPGPDPFVAVRDITGIPANSAAGASIDLNNAKIEPKNATNKTILWELKGAGNNNIPVISAEKTITPTAAATLELTATVVNGLTETSDYEKTFTIIVDSAEAAPGTPGDPPVVRAGEGQLGVSWAAVSGAASYEVWHGETDDSAQALRFAGDADETDCEAIIAGLENGKAYYIWIKAVNSRGASGFSPSATGTPWAASEPPAALASAPSVTAGNARLTVSWPPVEGAASYELWHGEGNDPAGAVKYEGEIVSAPGSFTAVITGLENGKAYYIWIKAVNSKGASEFSPSASGAPLPAPAAPAAPVLIPGDGEITVSWTAVDYADGYELWHGTTNDSAAASQYTGEIALAGTVIADLENDTTYYVWIKAKNSVGTSPFSPVASGTPVEALTAPEAPATAPTLTAGDRQLTASWQAVAGADSYEVWYGTALTSLSKFNDPNVADLSAVITGLTNGATYYVRIRAKNGVGTSGEGPYANATPQVSAPASPARPSLTTGDRQLAVSWTAVSGATRYEVWYAASADSAAATKFDDNNETDLAASITGLTNGERYWVWIKAANAGGTSGFSSSADGTPQHPVPAAPGAPSLIPGNGQLVVNWTAVTGAEAYEVWYGTVNDSGGATKLTTDTTDTDLTATIAGLTNDILYYVWIKAKNGAGTSAFGQSASGRPQTAPAAPAAPQLKPGAAQLFVTWQAVNGAASYEVWYGTTNDSAAVTTTKFADVAQTTGGIWTAEITGLTNGTEYYLWIKAKNATGTSGFSPSARGTPKPVPAVPVGALRGTAYDGYVVLEWDPIEWAEAYEVWHSTTQWGSLAIWGAKFNDPDETDLTATITGLANGAIHYFRLKAKNQSGTSAFAGDTFQATPNAALMPPEAPPVPSLEPGNKKLTASWTAVEGANSYEVYYGATNDSSGANLVSSDTDDTDTTAVITGLANDTAYYVWIKAKNTAGSSGFSPPASGTPALPPPPAPAAAQLTAGDGRLVATWTAPPDANSYEVQSYEVHYGTTNDSAASNEFNDLNKTDLTATITGLANGTAYYVWIRAKNVAGLGPFSPASVGTPSPLPGVPGRPTIISYDTPSNQLTVNWTAASDANSYEVYYSVTDNPATAVPYSADGDKTDTTAAIAGLTPRTRYYVWIKAVNSVGESDFSLSANGKPGVPNFTSYAALASWLALKPPNDSDNAYEVALSGIDFDSAETPLADDDISTVDLATTIWDSAQYVVVDLSECSGTKIPGFNHTGTGFNGNVYLMGITLPSGVTEIESFAFCNSGLRNISLPDTLTTIRNDAFFGSSLVSIRIPQNVVFEAGDTQIFASCSSLEEAVVLASGVIPQHMFRGCSKLTNVTLVSGITLIDSNAFNGCTSLEDITLPSGLQTIRSQVFMNCAELTALVLPASLTEIGGSSFYGCSNLASITLPKGMTVASGSLFQDTPKIRFYLREDTTGDLWIALDGLLLGDKSGTPPTVTLKAVSPLMTSFSGPVVFPDSLETFGSGARFENCTGITSITLPENAILGSNMIFQRNIFNGCASLTEIILKNPTPCGIDISANNGTFANCPLAVIYVPDSAVGAYQADSKWGSFKDGSGNSIIKGISQRPAS